VDKLRQWIALTVVAVLVIVVGSWFLLISPKRSEASDVRQQADSQVSANKALIGQISMLKAQAKSLPQKQAKLAAVAAKIPDNPALPSLIRALTAAADDAGVELISLAPAPPVAAVDPTAATTATVSSGTTPAKTPPAGSAAAAAAAGTLQSINVSLNVAGGYFQIEQFLDGIESLSRAMRVGSLTLAPGSNPLKPLAATQVPGLSSTLTGSIQATVFMASGRSTAAVPGK
jgi:type IV pilus assembly protein PilO